MIPKDNSNVQNIKSQKIPYKGTEIEYLANEALEIIIWLTYL